jgi:predicted Zn finger-like uncharacterized protein
MKVSCPACDSKYTIADEKVAGRKVKVRCKSCGGQILINGTIPPPAPDAAGKDTGADKDTEVESGNSNAPPAALLSSPPSSAPQQTNAPIDDGITWSVNVTETDERSLKTHEVVAGYLSGEFAGEVYVWHDGMTDWATIVDVPELARAIADAQKSPAASADTHATAKSARPDDEAKQKALPSLAKGKSAEASAAAANAAAKKSAARVTGGKRPENTHDLFAAASAAGSETDVSVSDDEEDAVQKRTGARNENSVLFSLDALKAGITASSPTTPTKGGSGKKAPAAPSRKIEDIMGAAAAPIAAGPATTLLNANQALLTAPAPPPPPPKPEPVVPVDPAVAQAAAITYAREKEKTKRLIIGSVAAIIVVGGIAGIAVAMSKGRTEPVAAVSATPSVAAAAPTPEPVKATPPATAEDSKPAESAAAPAASAPAGAKPTAVATGPAKTGGGAVASPGPKAETPKKETKKEESAGAVSSGAGSFNKEAAGQALAVAASQTSICKKPDGPTGQGKVQVTFAPSGRATTANIVSGPFGGTAVGGCVSGVFKRARVPAFSGDPVTVSKSFSITP